MNRRRPDKERLPPKQPSKQSNLFSRVAFWGVTITVGGLAIYLWNQSESIDSTKFLKLGDYLSQLYR